MCVCVLLHIQTNRPTKKRNTSHKTDYTKHSTSTSTEILGNCNPWRHHDRCVSQNSEVPSESRICNLQRLLLMDSSKFQPESWGCLEKMEATSSFGPLRLEKNGMLRLTSMTSVLRIFIMSTRSLSLVHLKPVGALQFEVSNWLSMFLAMLNWCSKKTVEETVDTPSLPLKICLVPMGLNTKSKV